jgi:hypothetical protein
VEAEVAFAAEAASREAEVALTAEVAAIGAAEVAVLRVAELVRRLIARRRSALRDKVAG